MHLSWDSIEVAKGFARPLYQTSKPTRVNMLQTYTQKRKGENNERRSQVLISVKDLAASWIINIIKNKHIHGKLKLGRRGKVNKEVKKKKKQIPGKGKAKVEEFKTMATVARLDMHS